MLQADLSRVPSFYHGYVNLVKETNLDDAFQQHRVELKSLLNTLTPAQWNFQYAPGKWSIKDLVQHVIDGERIFCYRALSFSRNDITPLPGFDENSFAQAAHADRRSEKELLEELITVQLSTSQLFQSFSTTQLDASGIANGNSIYVAAIGFIIIGHTRHHCNILIERYGIKKTIS